jgi:hypothetical protein
LILHFLPHFPGAPKSEGFCFQGERLHSGRDPKESEGGTGKAEDAKPPDAGISPKQCPGKGVAENERPTELSLNRREERDASRQLRCEKRAKRPTCRGTSASSHGVARHLGYPQQQRFTSIETDSASDLKDLPDKSSGVQAMR